jgi:hypothetical protein
VRAAVAAQGDEGDVLATRAFDATAGDDAARVRQKNDLEQHGRRVGARAGHVVVEAHIEAAEIDLVIEQMVQRMLERSGKQLRFEVHRKESWAGVNVLVAGHRGTPLIALHWPCNPRASSADCWNGFPTTSLGRRK